MRLPSFMENGGKSTPFRMNTRYGGVLSLLSAGLSTGGRASICPPRDLPPHSAPSLTRSAAVTDPRGLNRPTQPEPLCWGKWDMFTFNWPPFLAAKL